MVRTVVYSLISALMIALAAALFANGASFAGHGGGYHSGDDDDDD